MSRKCLLTLVLVVGLMVNGSGEALVVQENGFQFLDAGGPSARPRYHPERLLVRFGKRTLPSVERLVHQAAGSVGTLASYSSVPGLQLVAVAPGRVTDALKVYRQDPAVLYAHRDWEVQLFDIPNDSDFGLLWGLDNTGQTVDGDPGRPGADIRAALAWDVWAGDGDFLIAVIDSGVDYTHPDLADNIWTNPGEIPGNGIDDDGNGYVDDVHGYDFGAMDGDPMDDVHFHGTHVAGIIGAVGNNGLGVAGVNHSCKIVALKIVDQDGRFFVSSTIGAMQYIIDNQIRVSNASWGWIGRFDGVGDEELFVQALYDAIAASQATGHVLVAAAGNGDIFGSPINADLLPHYPANYDLANIIAVAATNNDDRITFFSNFGPTSVDVGAPGLTVYSTIPDAGYRFLSGTSMAAPHVTGVVALVASRFPSLSWSQIKSRILHTVRPVDSLLGITVTGGVVNAAAAVWDCNANGVDDIQDIASGASEDCNDNLLPDECEPDCNANAVADTCDIAGGLSADCNANAVPDECEADCNSNGVADPCDVDSGVSDDCNENGIPDECEPGWDQDCNSNGLSDLCELFNRVSTDCNGNNVPDDCDLQAGSSSDCTGNGLPDECERDCNDTGTADSCDIAEDPSLDLDGDCLIDDCTFGIALLPVGSSGPHTINGNQITMEAGQMVALEVRLSAWDSCLVGDPLLRGYQVLVEQSGFFTGDFGSLDLVQFACASDADCPGAASCKDDDLCDVRAAFRIDQSRPDFVFHGRVAHSGLTPDLFFLSLTHLDADSVRDSGVEKYGGTIVLSASNDARGTFTVEFDATSNATVMISGMPLQVIMPPLTPALITVVPTDCNSNGVPDDQDIADGTSDDCNGNGVPDECEPDADCNGDGIRDLCAAVCTLDCECRDGDVCTFDRCVGGVCTNTPRPYGDLEHDGDVDLFDLFCILNGFSGEFSICLFEDVDIEPCEGDGDIDLFDLFAVLNAFSGVDPCCGGLP